jgi:DNA-damage-inducible protein J
MPADSIVKARIDTETKERAVAALGAMGLSISDAIRLLMLRVAEERRLPFAVQVPNAASRQATKELKSHYLLNGLIPSQRAMDRVSRPAHRARLASSIALKTVSYHLPVRAHIRICSTSDIFRARLGVTRCDSALP